MLLPRIIPVLLVDGAKLVKSRQFTDNRYIGDPLNAMRIFNSKEVDELILLDISKNSAQKPQFSFISEFASECFSPMTYGGGIKDLGMINDIMRSGVEKVSINTEAIMNPNFVKLAAEEFGSSAIVVSIDVKKSKISGKYEIYTNKGTQNANLDLIDLIKKLQDLGAGEILINSIDRDGMYTGYDIELIKMVTETITLPVIACGGARDVGDFYTAVSEGKASAVAAGSCFVFVGARRSVLITYPTGEDLLGRNFELSERE